jgi:tagaturonate epimerase
MVVTGEKKRVLSDDFQGRCYHQDSSLKVCDLSSENTECLMALFPYTKPVSLQGYPLTIGTGDRLGVATPGHIRAVEKFNVRPVLAQQSVRENTQTGRDYKEVIRDAAWSVFQENYQRGYGADGDHLKSLSEVKNALDAGISMVTLDLSEKLNFETYLSSNESVDQKFEEAIDEQDAEVIFHVYLDKNFSFKGPYGELSIQFDTESVKRNTLLFHRAVDFTEEVYEWIRSRKGNHVPVDFEVSIDETPFPTSPENHFFFILQLNYRGVRIDSLAPRFPGEFQKGVNYRGNIDTFRRHFYQHTLIAKDYGNYKLSIHSGSDKFSVFPHLGELTGGRLHLKTAGTSWLEAMRLVTLVNPSLYREMHQYALSKFKEASSLYHVTTDLNRIPRLKDLSDQDLPSLLDQEDSRQLLHITYGFLLNAKTPDGKSLFRERLYYALMKYEDDYWSLLERHFEKHLSSLGGER